jgi:[ribosomal protein S5]-alanine N-acetyltransferase
MRYVCVRYWSLRVVPPSSARLTFRNWTDKDTVLAEALWCDPEVTRFFGGAMSRSQARDRLHAECERESSLGVQYWPIFLHETSEFAGCAGLRPWSMDSETIEVGVNLMRSAWGLRLGEEALLAVLAHGFDTLGLPVIVAGHGIAHNNSQKLLERVGFKYTHNILWGSNEIEVCMWAMTAQSWRVENRSPKRGFEKLRFRDCRKLDFQGTQVTESCKDRRFE